MRAAYAETYNDFSDSVNEFERRGQSEADSYFIVILGY